MAADDEPHVKSLFPNGHFYSPVVDPADLRASGFERRRRADKLREVRIDYAAMASLFADFIQESGQIEFSASPDQGRRYHTANDQFNAGDAFILASMIRHFRPGKIVEVGSGFSSAVILDTLDDIGDAGTSCTFIDLHTERIESLLRPEDRQRVRIVQSKVQDVDLDVFTGLEPGDFLFLDTTHVSKTGSDVNFELFEILPLLKPGVIVHFHDVFDNFEYPDPWIYDENRSWNELYILRAFLMYNSSFDIMYFCSAFAKHRADLVEAARPQLLPAPGGSLWLKKVEPPVAAQ